MEFAVGVLLAVVAILGSIALHEAGHLLSARRFGVAAPEFGVGFGPRLLSYQPKNSPTRYGLHLIPFGGFVKLGGMVPPPSPKANPEGFAAKGYAMQEAREVDWIGKKLWQVPTWQKVTIMGAGPAVNLVLGVLGLVVALCLVGAPGSSTTLKSVEDGSPAAAAGLQSGDRIAAVNGTATETWADARDAIRAADGTMLSITYVRDDLERNATVDDEKGEPIGVTSAIAYETLPVTAVPGQIVQMVADSVRGIIAYPGNVVELAGTTFSEAPRPEDSPMSMVGAGDLSGQIASHEAIPPRTKAFMMLNLFAALNFFLGLFNLLPLTPLDGGHITTAIASSIRRRVASLLKREDPGPISPAVLTPVTLAVTAVFVAAGAVTITADIVEPIRLFH